MKPAFGRRIERVWFGAAAVPWWLRASTPVYRLLRWLHGEPYRRGWRQPVRVGVPVIVVGNLIVGGSGKTPLVIALVEHLRARGFKPGVVSRGYGGSEPGPLLVADTMAPAEVGDEPCLIRRRTGVAVAIGRDRPRAAALLVAHGANVIVADDGLQNPALARDIEICVIDGQRRFGNARLLPAGPLRTPVAELGPDVIRVCNGGAAQAGERPMRLLGETAVALRADGGKRSLASFAGQDVHAVAAIGNPTRFFDGLRARGIKVVAHAFADHHAFVAADLAFGDDAHVLMTEKDAVKCLAFAPANAWCVPVCAELPDEFFATVDARLRCH